MRNEVEQTAEYRDDSKTQKTAFPVVQLKFNYDRQPAKLVLVWASCRNRDSDQNERTKPSKRVVNIARLVPECGELLELASRLSCRCLAELGGRNLGMQERDQYIVETRGIERYRPCARGRPVP